MKKLFKWVAIIFVGFIIIGVIFGNDDSQTVTADARIDESPSEQPVTAAAPEQIKSTTVDVVKEEAEPEGLSRPQKNAVRSAEQYISMTGFSRKGLIGQLSSDGGEGYDVTDATIAVDSLNIEWNEQAVRSARQYLDMMGFSCNSLIEQLSSDGGEGYTVDQATYGAQQAGACS
uniref:Ltp family lipoprotein n=1 Tax=Psychrobacter sp. TaxID=56811 RepID=UPI00159B5906|nr:Ltp family lipoprotein [Psychrobacter sp.]QJS05220.1 host cell surface-exposed lipoprotein [Psychrobacter sp.]